MKMDGIKISMEEEWLMVIKYRDNGSEGGSREANASRLIGTLL